MKSAIATEFLENYKKDVVEKRFFHRIGLTSNEVKNISLLILKRYREHIRSAIFTPSNSLPGFSEMGYHINNVLDLKNNYVIKPEYVQDLFYNKKELNRHGLYEYNIIHIELLYIYATGFLREEFIKRAGIKIFCEHDDYEYLKQIFLDQNDLDLDIKVIGGQLNFLRELKNNISHCLCLYISKKLLDSDYILSQIVDTEGWLKEQKGAKHFYLLISEECHHDPYNIFDISGVEKRLSKWDKQINKFRNYLKKSKTDEDTERLKKYLYRYTKAKRSVSYFHNLIDGDYNVQYYIIPNHFNEFISMLFENYKYLQVYDDDKKSKNENNATFVNDDVNDSNVSHFKSMDYKYVIDRNKPIFPPKPYFNPEAPLERFIKINVENFTNVWLENEWLNPTGTHKDRMAWETVLKYHELFDKKLESKEPDYRGPQLSLISNGSAAFSLQYFFKLYDIPPLKVLIHKNFDEKILGYLEKIGCIIYQDDLSRKFLTRDEIKQKTKNIDGFDITHVTEADSKLYYDFLSYEILNQNPDYCFIPYGTGDLFINILKLLKIQCSLKTMTNPHFDYRFKKENLNSLINCNFFGATTKDENSSMDKLYSFFNISPDLYKSKIKEYIRDRIIGSESKVDFVKEKYVKKAMRIAEEHHISHMTEPSGIAGLALLLQMKRKIKKDAKIIIINTGTSKYEECIKKINDIDIECTWKELKIL